MTTSRGDKLGLAAVLGETDRARKAVKLQALAQQMRLDVFDLLHAKGTGHWGGASSVTELLTALYFDAMRVRPEEPRWADRDRLILSKGHASAILYTVLAGRGYFPAAELPTFRQINSRLQGHPCMLDTPGVDMSAGALGHGMSIGLGMAMAAQLQRKSYWTYVIMGEGCLNEGQTWEAIMAGAKFRPPRLVALIDYNRFQLDGASGDIMPLEPLADKFRAFGWNVAEKLHDGHSLPNIFDSFEWIRAQSRWPVAVIYETHKGHGVSATTDTHKFHGAPIDDATYAKGRPELLRTLAELEAAL